MVIECRGKKVEWWRVHEEGLPNWSSCCPLLWTDFISLVPHFLSLGHGEIKKFEENYSLKENSKTFAVLYLMSKEEYFVQKYWVYEPHTATGSEL